MTAFEDSVTPKKLELPTPSRWIVVNTHPRREQYTEENLERQGYLTYCPVILSRVTRYRRIKDIIVPLFPSYIFVNIDPVVMQWRSIRSTFGVRSVLCSGDMPRLLESRVLTELQAQEVDGIIRRPVVSLEIDQTVTIQEGPLSGLVGKIIQLRERDRIVILMELLNRTVKLNVDAQSVIPGRIP